MSSPLDQMSNDIRECLNNSADRLRLVAVGSGPFADPQNVYLQVAIVVGVLEGIQAQLRRHGLAGGTPWACKIKRSSSPTRCGSVLQ
jgi:hypothetical protein